MNRSGLDCFAGLLERNHCEVRRLSSSHAIKFCCPIHRETTPSANAMVGDRVPVVARCHKCGDEGSLVAMLEALGATEEERREILGGTKFTPLPKVKVGSPGNPKRESVGREASPTTDIAGNRADPGLAPAMREVRRWVHKGFDGKEYAHIRLEDGSGKKAMPWEPKGVKTEELPLYGSELIASANGAPIVVTEGEKAADALRGITEIVSLGTVTGAEGLPSRKSLEILLGRPVILWPDADEAGLRHMERMGAALESLASSVSVVPLDEALGAKADAWDFVERYGADSVFGALSRSRPFNEWRSSRIEERRGWKRSSAASIIDREIAPIPSLLGNGLLPVGYVSIAYGYPGVGKSFLVDAGLALAISRGEEWFGIPTIKGRVLVLAAEWPEAIAQNHLRQYGAEGALDLEYVTAEYLRKPLLFDRPEDVADLALYARGFDLVIVDPLGRFSGIDLDVGFEAAKVTMGAQELAASGPAVLLLHHSRKGSANARESFENDLDSMRGSGKLQSDPVSVWKIAKHPSGKIVISFPKANFGRAPDPVWVMPSWDGPPEITTSPEEGAAIKRRAIKDYLVRNPEGVVAEIIARDLKISPRSIRRYLKEAGAINVSGRGAAGLFVLPDKDHDSNSGS